MSIKYINLIKEDNRQKSTSPTHKIVLVYDNGDRQYIGVCWYSDEKGFGSIALQDGVAFVVPPDFKTYPAKKISEEERLKREAKSQERWEKKEAENKAFAELTNYDPININDIPF